MALAEMQPPPVPPSKGPPGILLLGIVLGLGALGGAYLLHQRRCHWRPLPPDERPPPEQLLSSALGVGPRASKQDLAAAFKTIVTTYHAAQDDDKSDLPVKTLQWVKEAYDLLKSRAR